MATITIAVNISQANKWEGNAEFQVTIKESLLKNIADSDDYRIQMGQLIEAAIENYTRNNDEAYGEQMHADDMDQQQSYRELRRGG